MPSWLARLNAWSARNYYHPWNRRWYAFVAIVIGFAVVYRMAERNWWHAAFDAVLWAWNFRCWRKWETGRTAEIAEYRRMTGG